jgi:LytTR family transcriptional regulator, CO-responsive transcriptional regulator RcoM
LAESESFHHKLQRFDPGMIWLDRDNRVMALNALASHVLGTSVGQVVGREILQLHPEKSRDKIAFLLQSSACPVDSPPPMTMMINIPDRVLLIKVSKMWGVGECIGTCMVFYDLTDLTTNPPAQGHNGDQPRQLYKLPVFRSGKVMLLDLDDVVHFKAEGHYTSVFTEDQSYLCNLSLSDLETRLDLVKFVRVHRSYMINVRFAAAFEKVDDQSLLVMRAGDEVRVPVSRSNVAKLKSMFGLT